MFKIVSYTTAALLLGAGVSYASKVCVVTEVCANCSEGGDDGTKLRLYLQHCKDQGNAKHYEFLAYHSAPVAQCDFIRTFQSDIDCKNLGLKDAKDY